jgi:hypothetical protein
MLDFFHELKRNHRGREAAILFKKEEIKKGSHDGSSGCPFFNFWLDAYIFFCAVGGSKPFMRRWIDRPA